MCKAEKAPKPPLAAVAMIDIVNSLTELLDGDRKLIVACSGGVDSMALLFCASLIKNLEVEVVHCTYNLRSKNETDRALKVVDDFCVDHNYELHHRIINIPGPIPSEYPNLENACRVERHAQFNLIHVDRSIDKVATAHTANDQIETLLMRLCRGTGLKGLSCIAEVKRSKDPSVATLIRPMLRMTKDTLLEICVTNQISFVEDTTNLDTKYDRSYMRHNIVPYLKHRYPQCIQKAGELCDLISTFNEEIDLSVDRLMAAVAAHEADAIKYKIGGSIQSLHCPIDLLRYKPASVLQRFLHSIYSSMSDGIDLDKIDRSRYKEVMDPINFSCEEIIKPAKFNWPRGVVIEINNDRFLMTMPTT